MELTYPIIVLSAVAGISSAETRTWSKGTGFSCGLEKAISKGRNVVERNRVQLWAGESTAQTGTKSMKKPGLAAGWRFVSESRNKVEGNRVQLRLEGMTSQTRTKSTDNRVSLRADVSTTKARMWLKETGFSCGLEVQELSLAGVFISVYRDCCVRSLRRIGLAASLTRVHFM